MPLSTLAPDQRAVVQLILQRERSYAQIAELLSIPEDAVRDRAHAGLSALAPDAELPADELAQISDFLLGQQNGKPRTATRRLLRSSNGARAWAEAVRAELEGLGAPLPELPARPAAAKAPEPEPEPEPPPEPEPEPAPPTADRPAPRPRPLRDQARSRTRPVAATQGPQGAVAAASSRAGGAVMIGLAVIAIVAIVLWLFVFRGSDDDGEPTSAGASPTPTATAAQPSAIGQLALKGTGAARKATGALAVYAQQKQLLFALQVKGMPPTPAGRKYALWLSGPGDRARWIGDVPKVGKDGVLQVQGPRQQDTKFTRDFALYRQILITSQTGTARKQPGPTLVRGTLPRG